MAATRRALVHLAEQRLDYLTELFETGRWRRFHSERAFLENIQEAKVAVETWRDLMAREAAPDHIVIDMASPGGRAPLRQRAARITARDQSEQQQPCCPSEPGAAIVVEPAARNSRRCS